MNIKNIVTAIIIFVLGFFIGFFGYSLNIYTVFKYNPGLMKLIDINFILQTIKSNLIPVLGAGLSLGIYLVLLYFLIVYLVNYYVNKFGEENRLKITLYVVGISMFLFFIVALGATFLDLFFLQSFLGFIQLNLSFFSLFRILIYGFEYFILFFPRIVWILLMSTPFSDLSSDIRNNVLISMMVILNLLIYVGGSLLFTYLKLKKKKESF